MFYTIKELIIRLTIHHSTVRYLISGGLAALSYFAILSVFVEVFAIWYIFASISAFIASSIVSFVLQKFWTFQDFRKRAAAWQFPAHVTYLLIALSVHTTMMYIMVDIWGIWYLAASVVASGGIAVASFFVYQRVLYAAKALRAEE